MPQLSLGHWLKRCRREREDPMFWSSLHCPLEPLLAQRQISPKHGSWSEPDTQSWSPGSPHSAYCSSQHCPCPPWVDTPPPWCSGFAEAPRAGQWPLGPLCQVPLTLVLRRQGRCREPLSTAHGPGASPALSVELLAVSCTAAP